VVTNHTTAGVQAQTSSAGSPVFDNLERAVLTHNEVGLRISNNNVAATARITNVLIANNTTGILRGTNGIVASFGNNRIAGNTATDGTPNLNIPQQ
jgi:hypothetical protein